LKAISTNEHKNWKGIAINMNHKHDRLPASFCRLRNIINKKLPYWKLNYKT